MCLIPTPHVSDIANLAFPGQDSVLGCRVGGTRHSAGLDVREKKMLQM